MATNKKPVTCYLSEQLKEALSEYCTKNGLVHHYKKEDATKPQLGTAITRILEDYFFDKITVEGEGSAKSLLSEIDQIKLAISDLSDRVVRLERNGLSTVSSQGLNPRKSSGLSTALNTEETVSSGLGTVNGNELNNDESSGLSTVNGNELTRGESNGLAIDESSGLSTAPNTGESIGSQLSTVNSSGLNEEKESTIAPLDSEDVGVAEEEDAIASLETQNSSPSKNTPSEMPLEPIKPTSKDNGISAEKLGKRLGRTGQAVRQQQKKGEKHFAEWTRNLDPEGKAWKANRNGKQVRYYLV